MDEFEGRGRLRDQEVMLDANQQFVVSGGDPLFSILVNTTQC